MWRWGRQRDSGYTTEKTEIATALSGFGPAVETYDVNAMLAVFDDSDKSAEVLTIIEGSFTYTKTYATLKQELEDDEINQLTWRKPATETGGHGYKLEMVLGNFTYSNMSATGGCATQTFTIYESAKKPAIQRTLTDSGTINWQMAKIADQWKVTKMTIIFNQNRPNIQFNKLAKSMQASTVKGFGLGHRF